MESGHKKREKMFLSILKKAFRKAIFAIRIQVMRFSLAAWHLAFHVFVIIASSVVGKEP